MLQQTTKSLVSQRTSTSIKLGFGLASLGIMWGCTHAGSWCQKAPVPTNVHAANTRPAEQKATKKTFPLQRTSPRHQKGRVAHRIKQRKPPKPMPFAVVELFTSEGCSSCPAADRLAGRLGRLSRKHKQRIFPIVYHVDYWDHLGWRDRFGKRSFTLLQQAYTRAFRSRNLYTPQMIVNGRWQFVGSQQKTAALAIQKALRLQPKAHIHLCLTRKPKGRQLRGRYTIQPPQPGMQMSLALVEWGLKSRVTRGENAGQILHNDEVARAFQQQNTPSKGKGRFRLLPPPRLNKGKAAIIAFLRDPRTYRIIAADRIYLKGNQCQ